MKIERYWTKTEYADFWKNKEHRAEPDPWDEWRKVCGPSRGYWADVRRTEPEGAAERQQATKFGPHWAVDKVKRPNGRSYTSLQSPYDPVNHFEGQRYGAAHALRFDIKVEQSWRTRILPALRRWAAEPAGERPYGPRPHELKWLLVWRGISNDRYHSERLRDLRKHIHERRRESGAAFQELEWGSPPHDARQARGILWAELEGIELYRRSDQLRWFIDGPVDDGNLDPRQAKQGDPADAILLGRDSQIAAFAGFEFQEVDNTIEERRARYGRPLRLRKKPGRKPNGECAMSGAERVRNHRKKPA